MSEYTMDTLTVPEQAAALSAAIKCRNDAEAGPFASLAAFARKNPCETLLTESQQDSAFQAAVKCCVDEIDAGPFNDFVSLLARRVMANVYK